MTKALPKIALGAWAWGNDGTFGGSLTADSLKPIFDAAMNKGLNLWDTAYVYGMGTSEKTLGSFLKGLPRDSYIISDKLTPQCMDYSSITPVEDMLNIEYKMLGIDSMDIYWVHNPVDAPKWITEVADKHDVAPAQIPVAWAIAKGALPIIGVTKVNHVEDAVKACNIDLTQEKITMLENTADSLELNLIRMWEKKME